MKRVPLIGIILTAVLIIAASKSFNPNSSPKDFAAWQDQTRAFLADALYNGPAPEAVPLEAAYGEKQTRDGYEITHVSFHDRPGHVTTGWLAKPLHPQAQKLPAILALHGHGGSALANFDPKGLFYYGDFFAKKGYIVLAIDIDHKSLQDVPPWISWEPLPKKVKFPYMGQRVWMARTRNRFSDTDPQVDPQKIGVIGLSNGGVTLMYVAALDSRIKLTVASGSLIMSDRMWHSNLIHCRCQYLYKLDGALDYYDIFSLIAPRPLLIQSGERDPIFPIASAKEAFTHISKAYALAGAPDKVAMDVHDGEHEFRSGAPEQWVEKYLPIGE